jgi:hypothetical protein
MRFALAALALTGAAAAAATAAYGRGVASGVPQGFDAETAAAVGASDLWVLGGYRCGSTFCDALVRSTDAGKHFRRVGLPPFPSKGTVPTLEFANARDGFAFVRYGGPLYVTHDGGSSWHRAGVSGKVISFALGGGDAYVVTAPRSFERSPVAEDRWRALRLPSFKRGYSVSLAVSGARVWLLGTPQRRHANDSDELALSADRGLHFALRPGPCFAELSGTLVPARSGVVWAVCPTGMMAELRLSKDGGRTFPGVRSVHDPGGLRLPSLTNGARIAAMSARDAVLYSGGQGPLLRTSNLGARWTSLRQTARFEQVFWFGFSSSRVGAAVVTTRSHPSRGSLRRTTDGGATWVSIPIR